jgi:hypothetical protein
MVLLQSELAIGYFKKFRAIPELLYPGEGGAGLKV